MQRADYAEVYPNNPTPRESLRAEFGLRPWSAPDLLGTVTLINAKVIDAQAGKVLDGLHTLVVEKGTITKITTDSNAGQSGGKVYDLGGKYVCPGLIDGHVHITAVPGTNSVADMTRLPEQTVTLRTTYTLRRMLQRGFTGVRDCGGATKIIAEALHEGLIEGPRLFQCGKAISQTGGHGDFAAVGTPGMSVACCGGHSISLGRVADGVPAVLKAVREELKQGADFIKIMLGGGVASECDAIETVQYSLEEVKAVTSSAWQYGKKMTTAHAYTIEAINHAIEGGCRGIEHGNLMDKATAKLMAEKEIWYTPTISTYGVMAREPFAAVLNEDQQRKSAQVSGKGLEALKMADEAGVQICYGSDLLSGMQACQTEEFTCRSKALSAEKILRQATVNPAKMLGLEGKAGILKEGAVGDIIILNANPLEDITVLDRPDEHLLAVIQRGKLVSGQL